MATSDHVKALIRSFMRRDDSAFMTAAHYLIAEERERGHSLLAADLEALLSNGHRSGIGRLPVPEVPLDKERGLPLLEIERSELNWERIVLKQEVCEQLTTIVAEFVKRDVLKSYGTKPKQKLLFFGPPGCGKTLASRVLAGVLGLPIAYVRFDSVVSSYLGETAANLRKVFDFVRRGSWIVLFDEFDAIGKSRDDAFEHGELKRVVNSLLQMMDSFNGDNLLIAATNHEALLDYAVWRRFDEICYFDYPTIRERAQILGLFLRGVRHEAVNLEQFARDLGQMSGNDIERVCLDAVKNSILLRKGEVTTDDLAIGLKRQKRRMSLAKSKGTMSECGRGSNAKRPRTSRTSKS